MSIIDDVFYEGLIDGDIADTDIVDTTKTEDLDFEDTLSGIIQKYGDSDISDLSDTCKCGSTTCICKESVVRVNGEKYRVQVSVTKL